MRYAYPGYLLEMIAKIPGNERMYPNLRNSVIAILLLVASNFVEAKAKLDLQASPPSKCSAPGSAKIGEKPVEIKRIYVKAEPLGNDTTLYAQVGGGSLVAGLLLGPLGAAANSAAVRERTQKQAQALGENRFFDPRPVLEQALITSGLSGESGMAIQVTPFILYVRPKKSDDVERRLTIEIRCEGWVGRYSYHLAAIPHAQLEQAPTEQEVELLRNHFTDATMQLLALFKADLANELPPPNNFVIESWQLNPFFKGGIPQGMRGQWGGRQVVVGQGDIEAPKAFLGLMAGMHLLEADRFTVGKAWD